MWKKKPQPEKKHKCPCCGYDTIADDQGFPCFGDICPVCFWEMDFLADPEEPSSANHGLTLSQARENYKTFGACEKEMLRYVRPPEPKECSGIAD